MKYKKLIITLSSICSLFLIIICGILLIICGYFFGYKTTVKRGYKEFYKSTEVFCKIPGLDTNYVPQAIAYNDVYEFFIIAGYDSEGEPSNLYILNKNGKELKKVSIKLENDSLYTGHAGGIVTFNNIIFVSYFISFIF